MIRYSAKRLARSMLTLFIIITVVFSLLRLMPVEGYFQNYEKMNDAQIQSVEENGIRIYDNFYLEQDLTNDSTMRIFESRDQVNLACLMEGEFPKAANEIAIDRMYADNNKISIGDTLKSDTQSWKVTGLIALPDYSGLVQNNNDSMFDSVKFGVGIVTPEEFETLDQEKLQYNYAWIYDQQPVDEKEEKEVSEDLMEDIGKVVNLETFVPRYLNQAIIFTGDDMGGDKAMVVMLLYIVIVIMAFVFGITISNTIRKEAGVIGTLRASGYTRRELIFHYMTLPVLVTLIGALIGNILGYTVFKGVCAGMYYGSYSLPTYVTIWNAEAFLLTTVVPILIMLVVNSVLLWYKLKLSPLKFLRRDLSRRKQKHALPLSEHLGFFHRFRIRVILQNMSNYAVLFVGIIFANMLLMFGLMLPSVLDHYQVEMENGMLSKYHYYTGIIFQAYTYGTGEPLIKGGRYNQLMKHFGKPAASIGFAIVVDNLLMALSRQKLEMEDPDDVTVITYRKENRIQAIKEAKELRAQGKNVALRPEKVTKVCEVEL